MSSRALRKLREERERTAALEQDHETIREEEESSDESSDDDDSGGGGGGFGFGGLMDSDSDESSESEGESESEDDGDGDGDGDGDDDGVGDKDKEEAAKSEPDLREEEDGNGEQEEEEDLDAILSEFREQTNSSPAGGTTSHSTALANGSTALLSNFDNRDLDLEKSMGSLLGGGGHLANLGLNAEPDAAAAPRMHPAMRGRNQRGMRPGIAGRGATPSRKFVFGRPGESWGRPPSFVGGGLGMDYVVVGSATDGGDATSMLIPWPYGQLDAYQTARFHTFTRSDSYAAQCTEYELIASSGDVNALALFVADNPYHAEASLQLCSVLFHTNNREAAMDLLKRVLWIYECAVPASFLPGAGSSSNAGGGQNAIALMDQTQEVNAGYFSALFRLMRSSCMVGCVATSLAVARYLLSLDPLRDPMGVLLTLEYFALMTQRDDHARFVVDLVESGTVKLYHRDGEEEHCGDLCELPNWAYQYALALYRLRDSEQEDTDENGPTMVERADVALQEALRKFPPVLELLLDKNDVDITGRSMQMDWPAILPHFRKVTEEASQTKAAGASGTMATAAGAHLVKIFVQRSHKLWSGDDVVKWLYKASWKVAKEASDSKDDSDESNPVSPFTFHPALIRYMSVDPSDYEDAFTTLPPDANPLDPNLVAPALALDPNRRRMGRRMQRGGGGGGGGAGGAEDELQHLLEQMQLAGLAGPGGELNMVDADLPLMELFLRSLMPWNHVEGVPGAPEP